MRKKKLLFHSNHHNALTGFGKNCKNILSHLYKTGKYEIIEYANGLPENPKENQTTPWELRGSIPTDPVIQKIWQSDPGKSRSMGYGGALIDEVIKKEKPDVYIGAEDIWAFSGYWDKPWWNKPTCAIWTTIDSLPVLPEAVGAATKIKNYFVWASFAEKALKALGHQHVRTVRGSIRTDDFFPFDQKQKKELRRGLNLNEEDFIIGFVFRNQLRKSVPNLLDGFKEFKDNHPDSNAKLLLHTHWAEGWDIPRLLQEKKIDPQLVLTTYFCNKCKSYEIKPFTGQQLNCDLCGSKKSQNTTNIKEGVKEEQLNEIYNLMDVYCHPFTSGGQEIPVQEAKLTQLITLVTDYSCGEDLCTPESGGFPLRWSEYREPGTQFIKATTSSKSIYEELSKVYSMSLSDRVLMGEKSRKWVLDNFSSDVIGKKIEDLIDGSPFCDFDFNIKPILRNPQYDPPPTTEDGDWLRDIYKNILLMEVDGNDEGYKHWMTALSQGRGREDVLKFFKETAEKENLSLSPSQDNSIADFIDDELQKRLVVVVPQSIGDVYLCTSLLPSLKKTYPDYAIYFATKPEHFPILNGNPYIYKCIPYSEKFDDLLFLEGSGDHPGFFDIAFLPVIGTQKMFNYQHNGCDKIQFDLCTS